MKRILLIPLLILCLLYFPGKGQQINYFKPFSTLSSDSYHYLVGNINNNYLVLKVFEKDLPKLLIFNDSGQQVAEQVISIPELKNNVVPKFLVSQDSWTLVFQHQIMNTLYLAMARFTESGEMLLPYTRLDSTSIDNLGNAAYYNFSVSADRKRNILYRMIAGLQPGKLLMDFFTITSDGKQIERGRHYIPFNNKLQDITQLFHHTDGKSYFAIFDKLHDTELPAKTIIYQLATNQKDLLIKEIDFKTSKPIKPVFVSNTSSRELVFASLYHDNNSSGIKGILINKIDLENKLAGAVPNLISFAETKNGELEIENGTVKLRYKESRGDLLDISNCAMLGSEGKLTILLENRYKFIPGKTQLTQGDFPQQPTYNAIVMGNITPSQDFDLLRNYLGTVETNVGITGSNGSTYVGHTGIAPSLPQNIMGGGISAILSNNYTYHAQTIPNFSSSSSSSPSLAIQQEHIQLEFDNNYSPLQKGKLTVNYSSDMAFTSDYFANQRELTILNFIPYSNYNFSMEFFDADNAPYQALLINKDGNKPFHDETFVYAGEKKILTLFTTADNKKIGLAVVSW